MTFYAVQGFVGLILGVAAFAMELFALIDAARHRPDAYVAAGKRTKTFWVAITAVCVAIGFLSIQNPVGIFGVAAVVGGAIYLADVRPALQRVSGRGHGSSHQGPYGPW